MSLIYFVAGFYGLVEHFNHWMGFDSYTVEPR